MRLQYEILNFIQQCTPETDRYGFWKEEAICWLRYELARPYIKDSTSQSDWEAARYKNVTLRMRGFWDFGFKKCSEKDEYWVKRSMWQYTFWFWLYGMNLRNDYTAAAEVERYYCILELYDIASILKDLQDKPTA